MKTARPFSSQSYEGKWNVSTGKYGCCNAIVDDSCSIGKYEKQSFGGCVDSHYKIWSRKHNPGLGACAWQVKGTISS